MVRKKKLIIIICCCVATAVILSIGITFAYLGAEQKKENNVTVGKGIVKITESNWSEPETQHMENSTDKSVAVTNTGSVPCFIRVYMDFSDSEVADIAKVSGPSGGDISWSDFKSALEKETTNNYSPKWKYVASDQNGKLKGYFYYTEAVAPGKATDELITKVSTDFKGSGNTDSNIDRIKDFNIIVYSETVQAIDTDGTDFGATNNWQKAWESFLKT